MEVIQLKNNNSTRLAAAIMTNRCRNFNMNTMKSIAGPLVDSNVVVIKIQSSDTVGNILCASAGELHKPSEETILLYYIILFIPTEWTIINVTYSFGRRTHSLKSIQHIIIILNLHFITYNHRMNHE